MSKTVIKKVISEYVAKAAYSLMAMGTSLSPGDVRRLRTEGPKLAKKVQSAKKAKPFEGLSEDDKRLLLAYVVYFRQNLTTINTTRPNDEDAAQILHKEVFKGDDRESRQRMDEELVRQLQKAGLKLKD